MASEGSEKDGSKIPWKVVGIIYAIVMSEGLAAEMISPFIAGTLLDIRYMFMITQSLQHACDRKEKTPVVGFSLYPTPELAMHSRIFITIALFIYVTIS